MGAKGAGIGTIILGVAIGVISIAFPPAAAGFGFYFAAVAGSASMIAAGAFALTMSTNNRNAGDNRAQDFATATAGEGFPIPVVFGQQKITGNFLNYSKSQFTSVAVAGESGIAGKGGGPAASSTIGYEYHLTFEYGICMGPVDSISQVWATPGEKPMMGADASAVSFGASDYTEILLDEIDPQNQQGRQGGLIRVYKGSATQTRVNPSNTDPYAVSELNYRNICWALFINFKLGRVPQPRTYQFIVDRLPVVKRDDETTITGFQVRGSSNTTHPNYIQANPAAIIYEVLTNKLWGRGLSSDIIDEESFIDASQYFYDRNIGMGFTMATAEKLGSILDAIRQHVKAILVWDGDLLRMRVLIDPSQTHTNIQTLNENDVNGLDVKRPFWPATYNEIRVEFNNSKKNYRPDSVHVSDLGNMQITGKINPYKVTLNGFTDWNTVRRQAWRILRDVSYPSAVANFEINRFKSQLMIGDVFRLVWTENWETTVTAYFMVTKIAESQPGSEDLKITALEDSSIPPMEGTETGDVYPTYNAWEKIPDIQDSELYLFDPGNAHSNEVFPIAAVEVPMIFLSLYRGDTSKALAFFLGEKAVNGLVGFAVFWALEGREDYVQLGVVQQFTITGELLEDLPAKIIDMDRSDAGFQFTLTDTTKEADLLAYFNIVVNPEDDLETLTNSHRWCVIGEEFFQVGNITQVGTGVYRATNFVRARGGTLQTTHLTGQQIYFIIGTPACYAELTTLPLNGQIKFKAYPLGTGGQILFGPERAVTVAISPTNRIQLNSHGLKAWNGIQFLYDTAPAPLNNTATYYVRDITVSDFKVAATVGGAALTLTTAGTNVRIRAIPASPFYFFHNGDLDNQIYRAISKRPYEPDLVGIASNSTNYFVTVKLRWTNKGTAQFSLFGIYDSAQDKCLGAISQLIANAVDITFECEFHQPGVLIPTTTAVVASSYTPDQYANKLTGCWAITLPKQGLSSGGPYDRYRIYTKLGGYRSMQYLEIIP
jgi:hypothetical protein